MMNKDFQKFFFFFFWWNIIIAFQDYSIITPFKFFDFVFVILSMFYLFKLIYFKYNYKNDKIPSIYKFIFTLLLITIFINIFRNPPLSIKGFIRFTGHEYFIAAWFPALLFYVGSKIKFWSQIFHYALKLNKYFVLFSPLIIILFIIQGFIWTKMFVFIFLFPILLVNWDILNKEEKTYLVISLIVALFLTIFGGSRFHTLRILYYLPILFFLFLMKRKSRNVLKIINMFFILICTSALSIFIYNGGFNSFNFTKSEKEQSGVYKFTNSGFKNSRKEYAYPDFFADMKETQDWLIGRGINGTYYSKIFEVDVDKDLNEKNSLGITKGNRTGIECGYLHVILKIGLLGLFLKLLLALPAIYLGLFKSNNWFVKGCAFIIIEWLIGMYPAALPRYDESYMLFWLCIGACISRETRKVNSSLYFITYLVHIKNKNKSFININHF